MPTKPLSDSHARGHGKSANGPVCAVGIFARAPLAGETKTRLIPTLGPEGAAAFHRASIGDTLELVRASGLPGTVFLTPASARAQLKDIFGSVPVTGQGSGNLGTRMGRALALLTKTPGVDRAFLLGTDSPDLPLDYLREAAAALAVKPAVLGPALDGGYTLVGLRAEVLRKNDPAGLFRGIPWSSPETLSSTVVRWTRLQIRPHLLPPWWDVDEAADLEALENRMRVRVALRQENPLHCEQFFRERNSGPAPSGKSDS